MIDYFFSVVEVKSCENGATGDIIIFFLKLPKKIVGSPFIFSIPNTLHLAMVILVPLAIMILQYQNMADKQACLPSWHPYTLSCLGTKQFEVIKALFLIKTLLYLTWKLVN